MYKDEVWRGGTKQIPFEADAPEGSRVLFLSDDPTFPESRCPGVLVCPITSRVLLSKYGYFVLPVSTEEG